MAAYSGDVRELFSSGVFSVHDAARLTGIPAINISRWMAGYRYKIADGVKHQEPIWTPEIPKWKGVLALSFHDLQELRFVQAFKDKGITLPVIRRTLKYLRRTLHTKHPFLNQQIFTNGKTLFSKIEDENGKSVFLDLAGHGQTAIYEVILQQLVKGLVFQNERAIRWFPDEERFSKIVIDPRICFGRPIVDKTRIGISVLSAAYKAEQSFDRVADWYDVDLDSVKQAVSFHTRYYAA